MTDDTVKLQRRVDKLTVAYQAPEGDPSLRRVLRALIEGFGIVPHCLVLPVRSGPAEGPRVVDAEGATKYVRLMVVGELMTPDAWKAVEEAQRAK
jgi:hypothetical protein